VILVSVPVEGARPRLRGEAERFRATAKHYAELARSTRPRGWSRDIPLAAKGTAVPARWSV
jgi:hypothetical protein